VSIARISQIEHGEVTSFEVIARYVEALGGCLDLVADFGDRTVRLPGQRHHTYRRLRIVSLRSVATCTRGGNMARCRSPSRG
jgi:hypothetical protein